MMAEDSKFIEKLIYTSKKLNFIRFFTVSLYGKALKYIIRSKYFLKWPNILILVLSFHTLVLKWTVLNQPLQFSNILAQVKNNMMYSIHKMNSERHKWKEWIGEPKLFIIFSLGSSAGGRSAREVNIFPNVSLKE